MVRTILTDIEGTTCSIAFVKETLFPYARREIGRFVRERSDEPFVREQLASVRETLGEPRASVEQLIATLERWIDEDKKHTALKALQGRIWERGYRDGTYQTHVYADAVEKLRAWHAAGMRLCVYSSGSIEAQKLLFEHTVYGDLRPLFSAYFDTTSGPKKEAASYRNIVASLGLSPGEILFLSDVEAELDAASEAGLKTTWLVRPEDRNASEDELRHARHPWARTFHDVTL